MGAKSLGVEAEQTDRHQTYRTSGASGAALYMINKPTRPQCPSEQIFLVTKCCQLNFSGKMQAALNLQHKIKKQKSSSENSMTIYWWGGGRPTILCLL